MIMAAFSLPIPARNIVLDERCLVTLGITIAQRQSGGLIQCGEARRRLPPRDSPPLPPWATRSQGKDALPATPTKWKYRAIYRVGDHQVGVWSNEVSVTMGG